MAHPRRCRFLKDVVACTEKGTLLDPRKLVGLTWVSENLSAGQIKDIVLGQVAIAKANNDTAWLKSMAREATSVFDDTWVNKNIFFSKALLEKRDRDRMRQERQSEAVFTPVRDIRLDMDPSIPQRREEVINRPPIPHSPLLDLSEPGADELVLVCDSEPPMEVGCLESLEYMPPMEEASCRLQSPKHQEKSTTITISDPSPIDSSSEYMPPMEEASCEQQSPRHRGKTACIRSPVRFPRRPVSPIAGPSRRQSPRRKEPSATISDPSPIDVSQSPMEVTVKCTSGMGSGHRVVVCESSPEPSPKRAWKKARIEFTVSQGGDTSREAPHGRARTFYSSNRQEVVTHGGDSRPTSTYRHTRPKPPTNHSNIAPKVRKRKRQVCGIGGCTEESSFMKQHLLEAHIPTIFDERLPITNERLRSCYSALSLMAKSMLGRRATLDDMASHVNTCRLIDAGWEVTPVQKEAMELMCRLQGWTAPLVFTLVPLNSPATLIHWRALQVIAGCISLDVLQTIRGSFTVGDKQGVSESSDENVQPMVEDMTFLLAVRDVYDTHFHLDRTRKELKLDPSVTVRDIITGMEEISDRQHFVRVVGYIAVYCDPDTYPSGEEIIKVVTEGGRIVIGIHPKKRLREVDLVTMKQRLRLSGTVGLGEVGLDHSVKDPDQWYRQEQQLRRVLKECLEPHHVLVLHCRGMTTDPTGLEVYMRCLDIVRDHAHLSQKIHLHCFTGSSEVVSTWLETFPNTYFGFTGLARRFNAKQREGLRSVPRSRVLLETDGPYFPLCDQLPVSAPHLLDRVAEELAVYLRTSMEDVLEMTVTNAERVYGRGRPVNA